MRRGEYFHHLKVPQDNWTVLRLDGRGFSRLTKERFKKPFDEEFHKLMLTTTQAVLAEFQGLYAYTESDELSVLLPFGWDFFDRELEKVVSLSAGVASATFSCAFGQAVQFDSRIWISGRSESVVDYFCWRQADAGRCALNGWAYWHLRQQGRTARQATQELEGSKSADKHQLLFEAGLNFNDLPNWQKRGTGILFGSYEKEGFNPLTQQVVKVERRQIQVIDELPFGDEYRDYLRSLLKSKASDLSD